MYDSLTELLQKIHSGEDSTIEFKREMPHRGSLAEEIAAFANARGGVILIGVDDDGNIVGLDKEELNPAESRVVEICQDSIEPPVSIFTEKLWLDDKDVLKIEVPRSLFVHKSPGGYFVRQGSSKREMRTEHLARLLQSRSQARIISFDEQLVPNTRLGTLRRDLYASVFSLKNPPSTRLKQLLLMRNLLVREGSEVHASVAGLLMCLDRPDDYLYNSFIQAVYLSRHQNGCELSDRCPRFRRDPWISRSWTRIKFVEKHNQVSALKDIGRTERAQYSMRAVFEALVNAVVHRDYSRTASKIRLFMFADRLELSSPGALSNTMTVEKLRYGQATRNELLARLLSEVTVEERVSRKVVRRHFLERRGEGVGIILDESEALSGKVPVYEMIDEELHLTIFAAKSLQDEQNF